MILGTETRASYALNKYSTSRKNTLRNSPQFGFYLPHSLSFFTPVFQSSDNYLRHRAYNLPVFSVTISFLKHQIKKCNYSQKVKDSRKETSILKKPCDRNFYGNFPSKNSASASNCKNRVPVSMNDSSLQIVVYSLL